MELYIYIYILVQFTSTFVSSLGLYIAWCASGGEHDKLEVYNQSLVYTAQLSWWDGGLPSLHWLSRWLAKSRFLLDASGKHRSVYGYSMLWFATFFYEGICVAHWDTRFSWRLVRTTLCACLYTLYVGSGLGIESGLYSQIALAITHAIIAIILPDRLLPNCTHVWLIILISYKTHEVSNRMWA